jgi:hypothetical protein
MKVKPDIEFYRSANFFLRLEALIVLSLSCYIYVALEYPSPWLFLIVFLMPDLSVSGYLISQRLGSQLYNASHSYALPLMVAIGSYYFECEMGLIASLAWIAHIGFDRLIGFGLKSDLHFERSHLG